MSRSEQRRAAAVALYQEDVTGRPAAELLEEAATPFTRELVDGVASERDSLDGLIERHSEGWALDRIAPLERNILRVALYELLHRPDVPTGAILSEAVELASRYSTEESGRFVNGVLAHIAREVRPAAEPARD